MWKERRKSCVNSEENKNLKVPAVLFMILLCVFGVCMLRVYIYIWVINKVVKILHTERALNSFIGNVVCGDREREGIRYGNGRGMQQPRATGWDRPMRRELCAFCSWRWGMLLMTFLSSFSAPHFSFCPHLRLWVSAFLSSSFSIF